MSRVFWEGSRGRKCKGVDWRRQLNGEEGIKGEMRCTKYKRGTGWRGSAILIVSM
jgi:hypothetical protein